MKLSVIQAFAWAHRGIQLQHYPVGQEFETDDQDLISVSTGEGWTTAHDAPPPVATLPADEAAPTEADSVPVAVDAEADPIEPSAAPRRGRTKQ